MSAVPVIVSIPRMPIAMISVMPSCLRRRRRKKLIRLSRGSKGWVLLAQRVPQDDVVHEAPLLPSLVRVHVDREVDVEKPAAACVRRRVLERVIVGDVVGDDRRRGADRT